MRFPKVGKFRIRQIVTSIKALNEANTHKRVESNKIMEWWGKGSAINDVMVLGGGGKGFCVDSTKAFVIKSVTQNLSKFVCRHLWTTPNQLIVWHTQYEQKMNDFNVFLFQAIIQERDDERDRLRRELLRSQEQVHSLLSQSSVRTSSLSATSPASRPASFISVEESSAADNMSEKNPESEDDGKKWFYVCVIFLFLFSFIFVCFFKTFLGTLWVWADMYYFESPSGVPQPILA